MSTGIGKAEEQRLVRLVMELPLPQRQRLGELLGAQGPNAGPDRMLDILCDCGPEDPGIFPALTGAPGYGVAEVANVYVPGPFLFLFATNATTATAVTMSGEGGSWSQNNAATIGDVNLTTFMPRDADFTLVIEGYEWWVAADNDNDNPAGLSLLHIGTNFTVDKQGADPYTFRAVGHMTRAADVTVRTQAAAADGANASINHFRSGVPIIPRGVDMRNDNWIVNFPASTNIAPGVSLKLYGYGYVPKAAKVRRTDAELRKAAWLKSAAQKYGVLPLVTARIMKRLRIGE